MKVLFAMGNDQVSTNVANRYYEKYGEVLEYKNVFFFKALIEEVKRDKTYDRIIINEELEQFRARDLEQIDRYLFNSIDKITDELQDSDIIFICSDRREKGDAFVNKLFSIGIYNLLLGDDRNINPLCEIIKKPKNKREAKQYLNIDASSIVDTPMTRDDEVDERQIRNILSYYEGIKNSPEKYLETFDSIAEQYSRTQLKIIISVLPKQIRDVVTQAERYKYLVGGTEQSGTQAKVQVQPQQVNQTAKESKPKISGWFSAFRKNKIEQKQQNTNPLPQVGGIIETKGQVDLSSNVEEQQSELLAKARKQAQAKEQAELEAKAKAEAEAKNQAELAARAKAEAEAREQAKLAEKAKKEAEAREQAELAEKARKEAEAREQAELAEKARKEAEAREQAELAEKAKKEAEAREQAELAEKARKEAEAKHRAELDAIAAARKEADKKEQEKLAELAKIEEKEKIDDIEKAKRDAELAAKARIAQMEKEENVIIEVKPNLNAPEKSQVTQKVGNAGSTAQKNLEMKNESQVEKKQVTETEKKVKENKQTDIETKIEVEPQKSIIVDKPGDLKHNDVQTSNAKPNVVTISEEEKKMREEQEKLAMEQKRIKEEQAKLEEEKRRLKEEQEKLINAQNQLKANAAEANNSVPQYTNTPSVSTVTPADYKKMVVLVGANKVGTTFMVNAIAHSMANAKINTSILDMTRDRSMFYLYNQNDRTLRKRAEQCMQKVMDGEDCYLETNSRYLKVYTTIPGSLTDPRRGYKHKTIIENVRANCTLTIVDADFTTPIDYFDQANEVYLVQDLDLLKMPDATLFLRELKNRGLDMKKIKVIINKFVKTSLTQKQVIQTLSSYSDPSMSFYDTVLPSKVVSYVVPYNLNNYAKYIDSVCSGVLNYKGYSADFMQAIDEIGSAIFPKSGAQASVKAPRRLFG